MNTMKVIGLVTGGVVLAALIGGGIYWWRRRKQKTDGLAPNIPDARPAPTPGPTPSGPPRPASETAPRGHYTGRDHLDPDLRAALDELFPSTWPPDDATIDALETDDVVVFAVESEPTGNYTNTRQELINAKVLSVEKTVVRGRVVGPVAHAEHHGSHAGHGFRVGDLVEVPRSKILVAARPTDPKPIGYGSHGKPAAVFKPSDVTKKTYKVKPGTPYDLVLPYRTPELAWYVDEKLVKVIHLGEKANYEQIMFSEDSLRGDVSVRALDEDPQEGTIFIARWDFVLDA
ncbi:MAG TPA: hypothetical protein VK034_11590 [Enhygromyxa sp.]|nr:hypothetical protein [Enhygromyxa sp.]